MVYIPATLVISKNDQMSRQNQEFIKIIKKQIIKVDYYMKKIYMVVIYYFN